MQPGPYQRKQYLINPSFQWKIAGTIAAGVFFMAVLISVTLYGTLHQQARLRTADPADYVAPVTSVIFCFAIGFAAVTAGGVGLWSILMTHRICGPMYVMKHCLNEIAKGRIPALRQLRKRDEFKDLHEALAQAVLALRSSKQREVVQLGAAIEAVRDCQAADSNKVGEKLAVVLERIEMLCAQAKESLSENHVCNANVAAPAVSPRVASRRA